MKHLSVICAAVILAGCNVVDMDQFGYYTNDGIRQWNIAPGTYEIKVGASSADIRLSDKIRLTGDHHQKPLRDHYFSVPFGFPQLI